MNILFVDEKDWSKKVPYTIHYLAEALVRRGHRVLAVDYDDTWRRAGARDLVSPRRQRQISKLDPHASVEVISPAFVKLPVASRLSTLLTHSWELARLLRREPIDAIVIYSVT